MGYSKLTSLIIGGLLATAVTGGAWSGELEFDFNSATFSNPTIVDNDFWPLSSLPSAVYFSEADDGCEVNEVVVSGATRSGFGAPYDGIDAIVVEDREWVDEECTGDYVLVEATEDWLAQDDDGNVWYLGEDTTAWDVENDCLSTGGAWEAGEDGAQAGVAQGPQRLPAVPEQAQPDHPFIPFGVIGIIAPWNYPLGIPMHEIVPALLAGNTVIFKTAPETQMVGRKIEEMIQAAGLPAYVFIHLNIPGAIIGQLLLEPDNHVDKLFFTGSVPVGKILMAQSAKTVKKVSMELGGNAPFIVFDDADIDAAVEGAMISKYRNTWQTCVCANRVFVQDSVYDAFAKKLADKVAAMKVGYGLEDGMVQGAGP